ncbi:MAG: helix-turn-helix transcriptional regulator [Coriobacteriales bacterium]|jgi:predicted transcriptional regulator YheO|nr:helix-turn-helix transcriptional regulator [Coriobacteriales bacterium]
MVNSTSNKHEFRQLKPMLEQVAAGIAGQFGSNCEVLVHDLTNGITKTVAVVKNGHVTGRKVGDGPSQTALEAIRNPDIRDRYGYLINSKDGQMLKSSTINIRGQSGDVLAVICINHDISDLTMASRALGELLTTDADNGRTAEGAKLSDPDGISSNVGDLLDQIIEESHRYIGKPVNAMSREDKIEAIRYLDRKGALLIKKSSDAIAEYYGISKYTLYNYLGRSNDSKDDQG